MSSRLNIKNFSIKFIDIMIGIILGLGFQWLVNLREAWQVVAFIFVYIDIVDFWIDYGPALKKFPPKKEIDVFLDLAICFALFVYIYSTQFLVLYFLAAFVVIKILDFFWLLSSKLEYRPVGFDKKYLDTWMTTDVAEIFLTVFLATVALIIKLEDIWVVSVFIILRITMRVFASTKYGRVYLSN